MDLQGITKRLNVATLPMWDDMMTSGLAITRSGAGSPPFRAFGPSGGLGAYAFIGTGVQTQEGFFTIQLSHAYTEGIAISPHIHWAPETAAAGDVRWFLEYTWASINGTFLAPQTIDVIQAASGTAWQHQIAEFPDIVGTGKGISSVLVCRLYRNPADGSDTYADYAHLLQIDVHILKDSVGSRQEFIK